MILTMKGKEGFFLSRQAIGDYIEATYLGAGGGIGWHFRPGSEERIPVRSHNLELTLCGLIMEPTVVEYRGSARFTACLFDNKQQGEQLRMWPYEFKNHLRTWYMLCVNGEVSGPYGPIPVRAK